jgi:hypothetical protein
MSFPHSCLTTLRSGFLSWLKREATAAARMIVGRSKTRLLNNPEIACGSVIAIQTP